MSRVTKTRFTLILMFCFVGPPMSQAQSPPPSLVAAEGLCGVLGKGPGGFGPFDYRTATHAQRHMVEAHHFTPSVEALTAGKTGALGADIDYTLRAFPNHTRALMAMMRLAERTQTSQPKGAHYLAECYFERAIRFVPQDPAVRALYAYFLTKWGRRDEAKQQLVIGEAIQDIPPDVAYNFGLAWFELGDLERSRRYARQAYSAGIEFPALRDKLQKAGHRVD